MSALSNPLQEGHQLLRTVRRGEKFGRYHQAHATLETTQQTSADGADRSGKDGAAKQPRTGDGIRTGETKRQCQPRNTGRSAEDGGVPGRR